MESKFNKVYESLYSDYAVTFNDEIKELKDKYVVLKDQTWATAQNKIHELFPGVYRSLGKVKVSKLDGLDEITVDELVELRKKYKK